MNVTVNVEVKQRFWLNPYVSLLGMLHHCYLITDRAAERMINAVIGYGFKVKIDHGKWRRLDIDYRIEIE